MTKKERDKIFRATARFIKKHPERYYQFHPNSCLCGLALIKAGADPRHNSSFELIQKVFGISRDEADKLYTMSRWPSKLAYGLAEKVTYSQGAADVGAERLLHYIKTGE